MSQTSWVKRPLKRCRMCLTKNQRKEFVLVNESNDLKMKFRKYLKIHIFNDETENSYLCNDCQKKFEEYIDVYKAVHRNEKIYFKKIRDCFYCDMCEYTSNTKGNLKTHIETAHEGKSHACQFCTKVYKSKNHLRRHIKQKHEHLT